VLPGLGPHVRYQLGGSDQTVGFVIGIFSFVALGGRLFSGPLADRRGRKAAILTGLISCALAGATYLAPFGIGGAYLGRMLQGFGEACLYTGAAAWAVELGGIHRSGQALGPGSVVDRACVAIADQDSGGGGGHAGTDARQGRWLTLEHE